MAPITSGNCPCRCNIPLSGVHHIRNDRAAYRARESSVDGFTTLRASRANSPGATLGARRAHSASESWSASLVTALNCSALSAPSYAAAASAGSDSSARAVSNVSQAVRVDTPSRAASVVVDLTALVEHSQHREILGVQPALLAQQLLVPGAQPLRRPAPQLVEVIDYVEHAPIKPWGYDTYPTGSDEI